MSSEDRLRSKNIQSAIDKISKIENHIDQSFYDLQAEQKLEVNIRVDNTVAHGMFKPDPKLEGGWIASEQTFRAMKKDIFALDEQMIDLQVKYNCTSCKTEIDRQFWNFCPHCGAQFSNIIL